VVVKLARASGAGSGSWGGWRWCRCCLQARWTARGATAPGSAEERGPTSPNLHWRCGAAAVVERGRGISGKVGTYLLTSSRRRDCPPGAATASASPLKRVPVAATWDVFGALAMFRGAGQSTTAVRPATVLKRGKPRAPCLTSACTRSLSRNVRDSFPTCQVRGALSIEALRSGGDHRDDGL